MRLCSQRCLGNAAIAVDPVILYPDARWIPRTQMMVKSFTRRCNTSPSSKDSPVSRELPIHLNVSQNMGKVSGVASQAAMVLKESFSVHLSVSRWCLQALCQDRTSESGHFREIYHSHQLHRCMRVRETSEALRSQV